ncbi:MAG: hypothetical protein ACXACI_02820 [Candidatus Hodarchaeales archaeon]|jgi:hypothetical protein
MHIEAVLLVIALPFILGMTANSSGRILGYRPPFEQGDSFFYKIEGHQISNTTNLKHNGTMFFIVQMRNSTHIKVQEVKHELVTGNRNLVPVHTEFHPVTYALIAIHSRTLVPFDISVWHWIDPTAVNGDEPVSIAGEQMILVEKTSWPFLNKSRPALHFQVFKSLIVREDTFEQSWYDCFYDAEYGFPLVFSTHYHLWETKEEPANLRQKATTSSSENHTISTSNYSISLTAINATFFSKTRTFSDIRIGTEFIPSIAQLVVIFSCTAAFRRIHRNRLVYKCQ